MSAGFKDVVESYHVGLDMGIRVDDAVTYSCLGCEVHDDLRSELCEDAVDEGSVCNVSLAEGETFVLLQGIETFFFQTRVIVIVHIVDAYYFRVVDCLEDMSDEIAADKAGSTGH